MNLEMLIKKTKNDCRKTWPPLHGPQNEQQVLLDLANGVVVGKLNEHCVRTQFACAYASASIRFTYLIRYLVN